MKTQDEQIEILDLISMDLYKEKRKYSIEFKLLEIEYTKQLTRNYILRYRNRFTSDNPLIKDILKNYKEKNSDEIQNQKEDLIRRLNEINNKIQEINNIKNSVIETYEALKELEIDE